MREFFKQIVINLYSYCGNRQAEKMTDQELTLLYDALCRVSKIYNYIPEEKQKEIIEAQLIRDKEYQNINARLISKWLEENGKNYYEQSHHKEKQEPEGYKPVEGADREKWLNIWNETLKKVEENFITPEIKGTGQRMREHFEAIAPTPKEDSALNEYCNEEAINKQGIEGTGETSGLSENSSNQAQQENGV